MSGVRYVVDESGERTAVLIDLREHGDLWEDFHDTWLAQQRESEPRESLESVREKLGLGGG